jgi:hypothetical protein
LQMAGTSDLYNLTNTPSIVLTLNKNTYLR